ncbi:MAG: alpha/beta hydrolase [Eubacteriales bacterium]|nr:alpha/beta hydrolase [Eubacteriales bacterium]
MSKAKKKRGKKVLTILEIIFGAIVLLNFISLFVNQVFFSHELDDLTPYGELVEVNGENMHVYSMGDGNKTIVLLPGFANPLPSADFGPLMRALAKDYTVVCLEYFGMGFSDETKTPRTNENYTEEIRLALSGAGFAAPYILMPHSGSGIYAEYYATKYPQEVSAIIMIDTTSSAEKSTSVPKFVYSLGKVQQAIGLSRPLNAIIVKSTLGINDDNGYTQTEIADYTKFMNHYYNDTIADQIARLNENIEEVMGMDFPHSVPVLKLVAAKTAQGKQTGEKYQNAHMERLGSNAQWQVIEGSHYLYHGHVEEICNATNDFLNGR